MPFASTHRSLHDCLHCELRPLRMFCNLNDDALADFSALGNQSEVPTGTRLFSEEEPSRGVILVCSGQVKLSCTSREGKTLILKIAMPGDVLGLSSTISGTPHEVTAATIEPTQIKTILRNDFLGFIEKHGEASLHSAKVLSDEYKAAFVDVRRLALSTSVPGRLASVILEWGRAASCGQPDLKFNMRLSHEELANMIGSSRETVTRALNRFKKEKLIEIRGVSVLILSPEKLESLAA
jgi:CRP/FNR family transcriptional regulator, cyclic AMP receptor protein